MNGESIHDKLGRVRKPRVHITYEVETGGATVQKELPFVVGVIGDFSGKPTSPLRPLEDRKFVEISRDNFDEVLARMTPGLNLKVENKLKGDGSEMSVQLKFEKMEDFDPANVAKQVEPLRKLLEARDKLKSLKANAELYSNLERELESVGKDEAKITQLQKEVGGEPQGDGKGGN